jgi:hypothetical protein
MHFFSNAVSAVSASEDVAKKNPDRPPVGEGDLKGWQRGRKLLEKYFKVADTLNIGMFLSKRRFGVWNKSDFSARMNS